ncbi:MAG TPA: hypothetical protein VMT99_03500 [Candidatus Paceibacterota bacterium]|nr:hypothetical protein [Candidatus Paceibacterota bacterium]
MSRKLIKFFLILLAIQTLIALVLFLFLTPYGTAAHGIIGMGLGLILFWNVIGGYIQWKIRDRVKAAWQAVRLDWRLKFGILATIMALLEEMVTVTMTNLSFLFGTTPAVAHITVSTNYLDVVLTNSVVLFVPMFFIWALILSRYDFSPNAVLLLWGTTGTLMEAGYGGANQVIGIGMWMFVYGLMIYLPAYSMPSAAERGALRQPRWWHYVLSVFVPPIVGIVPGGLLGTFFKFIRPPHYLPGVK